MLRLDSAGGEGAQETVRGKIGARQGRCPPPLCEAARQGRATGKQAQGAGAFVQRMATSQNGGQPAALQVAIARQHGQGPQLQAPGAAAAAVGLGAALLVSLRRAAAAAPMPVAPPCGSQGRDRRPAGPALRPAQRRSALIAHLRAVLQGEIVAKVGDGIVVAAGRRWQGGRTCGKRVTVVCRRMNRLQAGGARGHAAGPRCAPAALPRCWLRPHA